MLVGKHTLLHVPPGSTPVWARLLVAAAAAAAVAMHRTTHSAKLLSMFVPRHCLWGAGSDAFAWVHISEGQASSDACAARVHVGGKLDLMHCQPG